MSREKVLKYMPRAFKLFFQDVQVIVDCTEIFVEKLSDFGTQSATYSTYKGTNIFKWLLGILPCGTTTFISEVYEGKISDNDITRESGLVERMEPGQTLMADRGLTMRDYLAKFGIRLIAPYFVKNGRYLPLNELTESVAIPRVRIHVERCMARIKQWHVLKNRVPLSLACMVNRIAFDCAFLTNFWPPLVA